MIRLRMSLHVPPFTFLHDCIDLTHPDWRDVKKGLRVRTLQRDADGGRLVLFHVTQEADADVFSEHVHPGGEAFMVLKGILREADGSATYPAVEELVLMAAGSRHAPEPVIDEHGAQPTIVLIWWGSRVEVIEH